MANVTVTVHIESDDAIPVPVDGVTVRVFDAAGTTFLTEGTTGAPFATGDVEFTLLGDGPGISYVVRLSRAGYSFPTGATQTISVTDPPAPNNTFTFPSHAGTTAILTTVVVQDSIPDPVDDVTVRIYDTLDNFLTSGITGQVDDPGEYSVPLLGAPDPGNEYIVRLLKPGLVFENGATQTINVIDPLVAPQTNIFDFAAISVALPISLDPDMCKLSGTLTDVSLLAVPGITVRFQPIESFPPGQGDGARSGSTLTHHYTSNPTLVRTNMLVRAREVTTDAEGYLDVELPRGGFFEVHILGSEHPIPIKHCIQVPDVAGFSLLDLLFPYVTEVTYGTDPVNVSVGGTAEVVVSATLSSLQTVDDVDTFNELLEFTTADDSIADVAISEDGLLIVSGAAAGSTTLEVERRLNTYAPRVPAVGALSVTPPTVVVS